MRHRLWRAKYLLKGRAFFSILLAAIGIMGMIVVSHAIVRNATFGAVTNCFEKNAARERGPDVDTVVSDPLIGNLDLDESKSTQSHHERSPRVPLYENMLGSRDTRAPFYFPTRWIPHSTDIFGDVQNGHILISRNLITRDDIFAERDSKAHFANESGYMVRNICCLKPDLGFQMDKRSNDIPNTSKLNGYEEILTDECLACAKRPSPLPQPPTMFLVGTGLIGVAILARKNIKS